MTRCSSRQLHLRRALSRRLGRRTDFQIRRQNLDDLESVLRHLVKLFRRNALPPALLALLSGRRIGFWRRERLVPGGLVDRDEQLAAFLLGLRERRPIDVCAIGLCRGCVGEPSSISLSYRVSALPFLLGSREFNGRRGPAIDALGHGEREIDRPKVLPERRRMQDVGQLVAPRIARVGEGVLAIAHGDRVGALGRKPRLVVQQVHRRKHEHDRQVFVESPDTSLSFAVFIFLNPVRNSTLDESWFCNATCAIIFTTL